MYTVFEFTDAAVAAGCCAVDTDFAVSALVGCCCCCCCVDMPVVDVKSIDFFPEPGINCFKYDVIFHSTTSGYSGSYLAFIQPKIYF